MQRAVRPLISVLLLALSVLGLVNVYGDNTEVEAEARSLACDRCEAIVTQLSRTPLGQTFHLSTAPGTTVVVKCSREAVFLGDYHCKRED